MNRKFRLAGYCLVSAFFSDLPVHAATTQGNSNQASKWSNISSSSLSNLNPSIDRIKTISNTVKINADTIALLNKRLQRVDGETSIQGAQSYAGNTLMSQLNSTTNTANAAYNLANNARNAANNAQNTANSAQNTANSAMKNAGQHIANYNCDPKNASLAPGFYNTWYGQRMYGFSSSDIYPRGLSAFNSQISVTYVANTITKIAGNIGWTNGYYDSYRNHTGDANVAWTGASKTVITCYLTSFK